MGQLYLLSLLLSLLLAPSLTEAGALSTNKTAEGRNGKVFSLFSIVQFPNLACTTTSGTYTNGTCFTSSECAAKGGSVQGNCAAGFGVCCVFSVSATGTTISQNCTYIVNPSYPSNYVPTSTPSTLTYTIAKCQDDICRIRLDYDTFILTQPVTPMATAGQCTADKLVFTTTAETVAPGATTGAYGNYPYLCGTNTGLHSYLDLSPTSTDTATLTFTIADSTTNQFKIKVTQLSCSDNYNTQQEKCFQYFTGVTGTVSSYNYAAPYMIAAQQYTACIRQEKDHCCIQWSQQSSTTFRAVGGRADNAAGIACDGTAIGTVCSKGQGCSSDFILIPNSGATGVTPATTSDRYCGNQLSPFNAGTPIPVISCEIPFTLSHQTGGTALGGTAADNSYSSHFVLTYSQLPGTC